MSKNVKDSNKRKDFVSVEGHFPQVKKICFGFSHLTTNNHYGLKAFSQLSKKADTYEDLIRKFADWSTLNANEAKSRGKKLGLERIPYKQLSKAMKQICDGTQIVSKDSTVCVFQFHNHDYRLICKEDMIHSNIMHVIAFDLDFSAYNHG